MGKIGNEKIALDEIVERESYETLQSGQVGGRARWKMRRDIERATATTDGRGYGRAIEDAKKLRVNRDGD